MRTILLVLSCAIGCGDSGGIIDCTPNGIDSKCTSAERCDATTKKCETAKSCTANSECNGYACSSSNVCERNCGATGGGVDRLCGEGYKCNGTTFACVKVATCTPTQDKTQCNGIFCDAATKTCKTSPSCTSDATCGNYSCDAIGGTCRIGCSGDSDCATGKTCNTTTNICG